VEFFTLRQNGDNNNNNNNKRYRGDFGGGSSVGLLAFVKRHVPVQQRRDFEILLGQETQNRIGAPIEILRQSSRTSQ
jgi:hypothetical protein